jgi:hypothetical protein
MGAEDGEVADVVALADTALVDRGASSAIAASALSPNGHQREVDSSAAVAWQQHATSNTLTSAGATCRIVFMPP